MTCCARIFCYNLPYLRASDSVNGRVLGETHYVCDECIYTPKVNVIDQNHNIEYLLRPDTCRNGRRKGGKCCRLPFLVRDPITKEPISSKEHEGKAQFRIMVWFSKWNIV
jgi:hypothetical protein